MKKNYSRWQILLFIFLNLLYQSSTVMAEPESPGFVLSDSEHQWLKTNPKIIFTGDPNWLPYEAFDSQGKYIGIVSEHLKLITAMTGLNLVMSPSETWSESTEKAKQGLVDILSETDASDLKSHLNFTIPYLSNPIVIAMHSRENYVEKIDNIKDRKIALIKDYGYASKIRKKYSHIKFVTVDHIQDGLISISTGEVDALLCTMALCSYTIAELGLNNVRITGKTEFDTKLAFGVQKDKPELLSILNKAINAIPRTQQQAILDHWIKHKFTAATDYSLVFQVAAAAIFLLAIVAFWNRRLRLEVNLRIKTEEELKDAQEVLRLSHQRLLLHREHSPIGVIEWNTDFEVLDWNPAAEKIFKFSKADVVGKHITEFILPDDARAAVNKVWEDLLANKGGTYSLNQNKTKNGNTILCEWHNTPLIDNNDKVIGVTSLVDDITERQRNEENLRQSLKMDAIGKLTGGIAHDFNNMLSVILGFSELIKASIGKDDSTNHSYCDEVLNAAERARKLTSKLLEFSHKAPSYDEMVDVNALINGMQHLLQKTLTPRINLNVELAQEIWPIWLDKARLEDAILNICINSMHAMPDGGTLTFKSENSVCKKESVSLSDMPQGDAVMLTISDTGIGMTQDIKQKIFDPFFTTKGTDGTGLGLSQVYGFVQQFGGAVQVFSEPEQGTQFIIYIPRYTGQVVQEKALDSSGVLESLRGDESILVVDDEVAQLKLSSDILSSQGYEVRCAESASEALGILEDNCVDLMLIDVVMPDTDGYQLAAQVSECYPSIKIQMASGFTDQNQIKSADKILHTHRLQKPFTASKLLNRVRLLLDEASLNTINKGSATSTP